MPNTKNKTRVCCCSKAALFPLCVCVTENVCCFTIFRDEKSNHSNSYTEDANSDYDDVDNKSEVSLGGSSSSNHLDGTSHPGDLGSRVCSRTPLVCANKELRCIRGLRAPFFGSLVNNNPGIIPIATFCTLLTRRHT